MTTMKLVWPVPRTTPITQGFGGNAQMYARFGLAGHNGLDFGVPMGTAVQAAADGVVSRIEVEEAGGYGRHVRLTHEGGAMTIYAHLDCPTVKAGQTVQRGEVIGLSGNSGFSTGPHLHFELRLPGQRDNDYGGAVDPLPLLEAAENPYFPTCAQMAVSTALNLRLRPSFHNSLRGCLHKGDVVTLAGPQQVTENGFCFVPVVLWVAKEYLQMLEQVEVEIGQKYEGFHIFHDLSTVFPRLSTGFNCFGLPVRRGFPRKMLVFPLKKPMSR
jgi:Peptidase family M23